MRRFQIVAHRGIPDQAPENTLPAFLRAVELGAEAVEMDVRLTSDRVPVIFHYYYLDEHTSLSGPIFEHSAHELSQVLVYSQKDAGISAPLPTLREVLEALAGRIGMEIEMKGPEPESAGIIADVLQEYRQVWETIEVTSYEPALLLLIQARCPGLATDLLFPRSESWMGLDVVAYQALQRARLARARAVHLHPSQLSAEGIAAVRQAGIDVHAWDVNDEQALECCTRLGIARLCTDRFQLSNNFRESVTA